MDHKVLGHEVGEGGHPEIKGAGLSRRLYRHDGVPQNLTFCQGLEARVGKGLPQEEEAVAEEVAAGALEVKTAGEAAPRYGDPSPRLTPGKPAPSLGLRDAVGHRRRHEAKVPALARKASSGFSLQGSQPFALSPQEIGADELSKAKDILPARDQNLVGSRSPGAQLARDSQAEEEVGHVLRQT